MQIFKILIQHYFLLIVLFFLGRLSLFLIYFESFSLNHNYWLSFLYGIKMDTIVASVFLVMPAILLCFTSFKLKYIIDKILKVYFSLILILVVYIENATLPFFCQYDARPNFLFVEYLEYPKEVFSMIFADYKAEIIISFLMIFSSIYFYIKYFEANFIKAYEIKLLKRVFIFIPIAIFLFIGIRSSFGHRPANNSDAMFSSNRVLNEITKNSIYSIAYAIYSNKKHFK